MCLSITLISSIANVSSRPDNHHNHKSFQLASTSRSPILSHSPSRFQAFSHFIFFTKILLCSSCKCSKMHKFYFCNSTIKINSPFKYIFADVWCPSPEISMDGFQFYPIYVYYYTKCIWFFRYIHYISQI